VRVPVTIIDKRTGHPTEGELFDEVTVDHFLETQEAWRPLVLQAARHLLDSKTGGGVEIPQHFHWDWTKKRAELEMLAITFYGIEHGGKLQGLMKVLTVGHLGRLPVQRGMPLCYVDYLETAPWNIRTLAQAVGQPVQFGGVGSRLVEAAVRQSIEEGFKGRVGLHSLPLSESFYRDVCGMTPVGRDATKQDLLWYEYTPEQADQFLAAEK
jgi:hypothetical protein